MVINLDTGVARVESSDKDKTKRVEGLFNPSTAPAAPPAPAKDAKPAPAVPPAAKSTPGTPTRIN
jgi:hypothetical protein